MSGRERRKASRQARREAQQIPARFGRLRRWWNTRFPLPWHYICPITGWNHRILMEDAWGDCECRDCGKKGYVEYGC